MNFSWSAGFDSWPIASVITWRYAVLVGFGAVISAIVIPLAIYMQRRASMGQQIYDDGPAAHRAKQGTPTIGGVAFPIAAFTAIAMRLFPTFAPDIGLILAGAIGFADDIIILRMRRALGLRARWKLLLLLGVAIIVAMGAYNPNILPIFPDLSCGQCQWWFGHVVVLPDAWYWILAVLAVVGCANAVNLTDGVDGLAAGTMLAPLMLLTALSGSGTGAVVLGALVVFLFFNVYPAKVFMGDTGSLALGAMLAALAIDAHLLLFLPLLGIVFVVEALSVIAQVVSFKLTGKRIFKMSPLHHHFELSGWSERRVTATFTAVSILASLVFCAVVYVSHQWMRPLFY